MTTVRAVMVAENAFVDSRTGQTVVAGTISRSPIGLTQRLYGYLRLAPSAETCTIRVGFKDPNGKQIWATNPVVHRFGADVLESGEECDIAFELPPIKFEVPGPHRFIVNVDDEVKGETVLVAENTGYIPEPPKRPDKSGTFSGIPKVAALSLASRHYADDAGNSMLANPVTGMTVNAVPWMVPWPMVVTATLYGIEGDVPVEVFLSTPEEQVFIGGISASIPSRHHRHDVVIPINPLTMGFNAFGTYSVELHVGGQMIDTVPFELSKAK